jgi:hypothetical protein
VTCLWDDAVERCQWLLILLRLLTLVPCAGSKLEDDGGGAVYAVEFMLMASVRFLLVTVLLLSISTRTSRAAASPSLKQGTWVSSKFL